MPGGICALNTMLNESAVRCAEVVLSVSGIRMTANLGGVAKASFPTKSTEELAELAAPDEFSVQWESAVFHGEHPILGKVTARLVDDVPTTGQASFVRSAVLDAPAAAGAFYPALNRNLLPFQIEVPRLGLVFRSSEPIVNSAMIDQIPPIGAIYQIENRPRFLAARTLSTNILAAASPSIVVESCRVKLMELEGLRVELLLSRQDTESASFAMTVENHSSEETVRVTWMVWPEPEEGLHSASGSLRVGRQPVTVTLKLPRNIFYHPRWMALAIAEPFETDGAQAALFPAL